VAADDAIAELELQLGVLLRRARSFSRQVGQEVHPGLEPGAYGLLVRLAEAGDSRLTDLAAFVGVGKPTVSRQVRLLRDLGLVERTAAPSDARSQLIRLTEDGRSRLDAARAARRARFRELLEEWPEDDVHTLAVLLCRFNAVRD
jgi:DNA-binding MarR family transcriptional regulator